MLSNFKRSVQVTDHTENICHCKYWARSQQFVDQVKWRLGRLKVKLVLQWARGYKHLEENQKRKVIIGQIQCQSAKRKWSLQPKVWDIHLRKRTFEFQIYDQNKSGWARAFLPIRPNRVIPTRLLVLRKVIVGSNDASVQRAK